MAINQLLRSPLRSQVLTQFNLPLFHFSSLICYSFHFYLLFFPIADLGSSSFSCFSYEFSGNLFTTLLFPSFFLLTLYFAFSDRIITIVIVIFLSVYFFGGKTHHKSLIDMDFQSFLFSFSPQPRGFLLLRFLLSSGDYSLIIDYRVLIRN